MNKIYRRDDGVLLCEVDGIIREFVKRVGEDYVPYVFYKVENVIGYIDTKSVPIGTVGTGWRFDGDNLIDEFLEDAIKRRREKKE